MTVYYIYIYYIRAGERLQQKKQRCKLRFGLKWKNSLYTLVVFLVQFLFCSFTWTDQQWRGREKGKKNQGGRKKQRLLPLFLAKSFCFFYGKQQLLLQLFKAFVGRQVEAIKTERRSGDDKSKISEAVLEIKRSIYFQFFNLNLK